MPSGVSYTVSLLLYSYSLSPRKAPLLFTLTKKSKDKRVKIKDMPSGVSYTISLLLYSYPPFAPQGIFTLYSYIFTLTPFSPSPRKESFIFTLLSLLLIDA